MNIKLHCFWNGVGGGRRRCADGPQLLLSLLLLLLVGCCCCSSCCCCSATALNCCRHRKMWSATTRASGGALLFVPPHQQYRLLFATAAAARRLNTVRLSLVPRNCSPNTACVLKMATESIKHHRRLYATFDDDDGTTISSSSRAGKIDALFSEEPQRRKQLLRENLQAIGLDALGLEEAVQQSMEDASAGYDGRYGRSAIRTCQSFYYPKKEQRLDHVQLKAAAARTARQVEFLWKRHQSHQAEWVRHHDGSISIQNDTSRDSMSSGTTGHGKTRSFPLVLLLDNLRSAHNVGSLFRTADAAGCAQVVTVGITPHPFGSGAEKLQKSALGAEHTVPSRHFGTVTAALEYLQAGEKGHYQLVGMETTAASVLYTNFPYDKAKGVVLILGNEVTGVDTTVLPKLDGIVEIPMFGTKNSLNVAACAPIVLYEIIRQWNAK